ncbi:alpha/beta hydrolase family protein [Streptomyces sp. Amel2xB2]|uniref:alpha/beta hydrolase n=1 Tax=Streptomyces sp. Amel2xB2 TaxID=1305829 RepID=UPI000DB9D97E|nr:alpha/beta hydrolase [Streptomyces sp. Amel2xB2]RAJ70172.1 alpha/beta hydrolase family protein [Streptomyces sp. Amel2xB2]
MRQRLKRALTAAAFAGTVVTATTGWAAGAAQRPVTGPPPGTSSWRADDDLLGRRLPDPAASRPEQVRAFFAGLGDRERRALVHRHPLVVGNLDGAPAAVRYAANRRALRAGSAHERERAADPSRTRRERHGAREKAARYERLLAPGRHILAFDPRGRGQVAEVHGDLDAAERTAVIVPGSDIDLATFDRGGEGRYGRPSGMATSLRARMAADAPGTRTAVIAWTGYTTPVGLGPDAATTRLAAAGAPRLEHFLKGLAATGVPAPAMLCHSYGSVVCGRAAAGLTRREAADLVVFGSPGMHAESVRALGTSVRVWAARDPGDWIGNVPNVEFLGLGHGTDPASDGFGARVVSTAHAGGHTGYLAPGTASLANFAAITLRSYGEVRCAAPAAAPPPSGSCTRGLTDGGDGAS